MTLPPAYLYCLGVNVNLVHFWWQFFVFYVFTNDKSALIIIKHSKKPQKKQLWVKKKKVSLIVSKSGNLEIYFIYNYFLLYKFTKLAKYKSANTLDSRVY